MQDVVKNTYLTKASLLSEKVKELPIEEQQHILAAIEVMIKEAQKRLWFLLGIIDCLDKCINVNAIYYTSYFRFIRGNFIG